MSRVLVTIVFYLSVYILKVNMFFWRKKFSMEHLSFSIFDYLYYNVKRFFCYLFVKYFYFQISVSNVENSVQIKGK